VEERSTKIAMNERRPLWKSNDVVDCVLNTQPEVRPKAPRDKRYTTSWLRECQPWLQVGRKEISHFSSQFGFHLFPRSTRVSILGIGFQPAIQFLSLSRGYGKSRWIIDKRIPNVLNKLDSFIRRKPPNCFEYE
jgi:hypothetical protein